MSERFFHDNGESFTYRRLSERVPVFLQRYPFEQGWSLKSEFQDPVSLHRGRLELLKTAIANGHSPESVGLGKIETRVLICRAALVRNEQEFVVRHAQGLVLENKDLERLESVAFQRILAATGFDGASLDADEDADMATQRIAPAAINGQPQAQPKAQAQVVPAQEPQPSQVFDLDAVRAMAQESKSESERWGPMVSGVCTAPDAGNTPKQAEVNLRAVSEEGPESRPAGESSSQHDDGHPREPAAQKSADASTQSSADSVASAEGEGMGDIPVALQRQMDNLARRLGESSPEPTSLEEAKAAVLDMSRRLNPRAKKEVA